jgi:Na+-translocating ferredoxin:NAD+ oxidoreductase subunit G
MKRLAKASLRTAVNLLFFSVIGTAILAYTYEITHVLIAKSEDAARLKLINQVAPSSLYDNDLLKNTISLAASSQLGTEQNSIAYRGFLKHRPAVVVLQAIAPDGYSGKISLMVGIDYTGSITGVRVIAHNETPGLGDYIDIAKNKWINLFSGLSNERYQEADWKVKKDGGQIDYMAGATVTPRAVVKAVHKALQYYATNRDRLFALNASSTDDNSQQNEVAK